MKRRYAGALAVVFTLACTAMPCRAQEARYTEFRTAAETETGQWTAKITDEKELADIIIQLVSSKDEDNKDDYSRRLCVQVLDRTTRKLVQELKFEEDEYYDYSGDSFSIGDYNFDGYDDFSITDGLGLYGSSWSSYFLFDPETGTFFLSDIEGTSLEFDSATKTITSHWMCCAGSQYGSETYKLVDNQMVFVESEMNHALKDKEDNIIIDDEGNMIFETIRKIALGDSLNVRLREITHEEADMMILESENGGDRPVNLSDGSAYPHDRVGNPKYSAISPDGRTRISGYFDGLTRPLRHLRNDRTERFTLCAARATTKLADSPPAPLASTARFVIA